MEYKIRKITPNDNSAIAAIIRDNLKKHGLDIPGTAYFDESLDNLCAFYSGSGKKGYFVLTDGDDKVVGGIGFDEFIHFPDCAELQKLYLADPVKGFGLGYRLISFIEGRMLEAGYKTSYLETHDILQTALHIYEKSGYLEIEMPKEVGHGAMNKFFRKELS